MPSRTRSTSMTVRMPARRACRAAAVEAAVSWQSTSSIRPAHTAAGSTSSGRCFSPGSRDQSTVRSPGPLVDENHGHSVPRVGRHSARADVDPFAGEARPSLPAVLVVAETADVPGAPAEPRARHHGAGRLPARRVRLPPDRLLGVGLGKALEHDQQVGHVEAEPNYASKGRWSGGGSPIGIRMAGSYLAAHSCPEAARGRTRPGFRRVLRWESRGRRNPLVRAVPRAEAAMQTHPLEQRTQNLER